jgi:hypothetical protein
MTKLLEGFAGELAKTWWLRVLSPAFVFWSIGVLAATGRLKSIDAFQKSLDSFVFAQSEAKWIVILISALVLVAASAWLVDQTTLTIIRVLEGYWWNLFGLWKRWVAAKQARFDHEEKRWVALSNLTTHTAEQRREYIKLDHRLRRYPRRDRILPTRLGNILCAGETRPIDKYGLDAVTCWPRLWLLLPKENREDLAAARSALDNGARLWLWSVLTLIWAAWVWWLVPVALLAAVLSYRIALEAASTFADLVEAAFDTRRMLLYDALGWPKPKTPAEEQGIGRELTKYILRGSDARAPEFAFPKKPDKSG